MGGCGKNMVANPHLVSVGDDSLNTFQGNVSCPERPSGIIHFRSVKTGDSHGSHFCHVPDKVFVRLHRVG